MISPAVKNKNKYMIKMVAAWRTASLEIRRLKKLADSFLRKTANELASKTASVVVFIPPAVEPGEPPTSIKTVMINWPGSLIAVRSAVLKPAVLGVTDWKRESSSRSSKGACTNSKGKIDGRDCDQGEGNGENNLALHPVFSKMETIRSYIIPCEKSNAAGDDQQHDDNGDNRMIGITGQ